MRGPLLAALGAGVGTFVAMGSATFLVSCVGLAVTKVVVKHRRKQLGTACTVCQGAKFRSCDVCLGRLVLRCRAPVRMQLLGKPGARPAQEVEPVRCVCPACGATGQQRCLNCLGEGKVWVPA